MFIIASFTFLGLRNMVWLSDVSSGCCCKGHCQSAASQMWQFVCCDREVESLDVCGAEAVCLQLQSILRSEGAIHHPLSLWNKTLLPSVLEFLNKFPPSHAALTLGRNWVPCKHLQSPSFSLLHICPVNYSLLCFLMNASAAVCRGAKALPVTLTCAGVVPLEVPQMSSLCAFGLPCFSLVIY